MLKDELLQLLDQVFEAQKAGDDEKIYDLSPEVMGVYLEALSDIHFEGGKVDWLNEVVAAIDEGDPDGLIRALEREQDVEDLFLGSQVAAIFAAFRHRDNLGTIAQATGLKALLKQM